MCVCVCVCMRVCVCVCVWCGCVGVCHTRAFTCAHTTGIKVGFAYNQSLTLSSKGISSSTSSTSGGGTGDDVNRRHPSEQYQTHLPSVTTRARLCPKEANSCRHRIKTFVNFLILWEETGVGTAAWRLATNRASHSIL